ncbi:O-succinylbenzoic acid--CoA ligase, partial [Salmonella enterica subsp. enterica serovar Heidelberg str. N26457]
MAPLASGSQSGARSAPDDEVLSWRALCERIDALAGGFAAQGVREGDGVLLRAGN